MLTVKDIYNPESTYKFPPKKVAYIINTFLEKQVHGSTANKTICNRINKEFKFITSLESEYLIAEFVGEINRKNNISISNEEFKNIDNGYELKKIIIEKSIDYKNNYHKIKKLKDDNYKARMEAIKLRKQKRDMAEIYKKLEPIRSIVIEELQFNAEIQEQINNFLLATEDFFRKNYTYSDIIIPGSIPFLHQRNLKDKACEIIETYDGKNHIHKANLIFEVLKKNQTNHDRKPFTSDSSLNVEIINNLPVKIRSIILEKLKLTSDELIRNKDGSYKRRVRKKLASSIRC